MARALMSPPALTRPDDPSSPTQTPTDLSYRIRGDAAAPTQPHPSPLILQLSEAGFYWCILRCIELNVCYI